MADSRRRLGSTGRGSGGELDGIPRTQRTYNYVRGTRFNGLWGLIGLSASWVPFPLVFPAVPFDGPAPFGVARPLLPVSSGLSTVSDSRSRLRTGPSTAGMMERTGWLRWLS